MGVGVTQEGNDQHQLIPAVEQVEQQNGRAPQQMIVDDGYTTRANILAAADRGLDMIGGTMEDHAAATLRRLQARGLAPEFYPQNFGYHPESNSYTCPGGRPWLTSAPNMTGWEWSATTIRRALPIAGIVRCVRPASRARTGA